MVEVNNRAPRAGGVRFGEVPAAAEVGHAAEDVGSSSLLDRISWVQAGRRRRGCRRWLAVNGGQCDEFAPLTLEVAGRGGVGAAADVGVPRSFSGSARVGKGDIVGDAGIAHAEDTLVVVGVISGILKAEVHGARESSGGLSSGR
jgi:hypothetical protein